MEQMPRSSVSLRTLEWPIAGGGWSIQFPIDAAFVRSQLRRRAVAVVHESVST